MAQIKKDTSLRKAILQAAITGQLISTCHSELDSESAETGKELLDRIIEERNNKLLAEWEEKQTDLFASNDAHSKNAKTVRSEQIRLSKKIKKPEPIVASEIDEEEIPFEIPENWCWCSLGDICYKITDGEHNTPRRTDSFSGYYLLSARNILNGSIQLEDVDYVDEEEYLKLAKRCNPIKNDVLLSCSGTVGRCSIVNDNNKYVMVRSAAMLSPVFVNSYFLMYSIQSGFLQKQIQDSSKQTAQANLFQGAIVKLLLPLPPLAVQNAIVEKLEQVLPLVDAYENALLQKEELKSALPDKVKKAILQEAITGKLTEAWRKSATIKESGKQLLDRIIEERNAKALAEWEESLLIFSPRKSKVDEFSNENSRAIGSSNDATSMSLARKNKKTKKPVPVVASEIEEEDIPFEVPESWCWCRLGDIVDTNIGLTYSPSDITKNEGIAVLRSNNIKDGKIVYDDLVYVNKEVSERCLANKGDLLICARNGSRALVGKCALIEKDGMAFGAFMAIIRSDFNPYILHFINSPILFT